MPRNRGRSRHSSKDTFALSAQEKRLAAQVGLSENAAKRELLRESERLDKLEESLRPKRTKIHSRDL